MARTEVTLDALLYCLLLLLMMMQLLLLLMMMSSVHDTDAIASVVADAAAVSHLQFYRMPGSNK